MPLLILRFVFLMVACGLGVSLIRSGLFPSNRPIMSWIYLFGTIGAALFIILLDTAFRRKKLDIISSVYFGMIVGFFMAYVAGLALEPLLPTAEELNKWLVSSYEASAAPSGQAASGQNFETLLNRTYEAERLAIAIRGHVQIVLSSVFCYLCISFLIQTRNDFRFIIPYIEFSKEAKGRRPYVLDTSVVIDGRIADVIAAKVLDTQLIMPRFVIGELQAIADSSDRLRRSRGRRGLDILNQLRNNPNVDIVIDDRELPEYANQPIDSRLVLLAKNIEGKLVTNDYNLNKVASLHGVEVVNLNDLANALKPAFLPGEQLIVRIVKLGEESSQGVGYLEDGTMVVVEGGREHIHELVDLSVTSVLQTSAGRMIFGRFEKVVPQSES
jgi:uncharacterized protein YacL